MNILALPISPACFVCNVPATHTCKCDDDPSNSFYLCFTHLVEHLNREGNHEIKRFEFVQTEKFPVEVDEEALEGCNFNVRGHNRPITSIALTRKFLMTGEKDGIYKWNLKTTALVYRFVLNNQVWSVASYFSLVAAGLDNCSVLVYDINTYEQKFLHTEHSMPVLAVKFTVSGEYLISGCAEGVQVVYSVEDNTVYSKEKVHTDAILCVSVSFDSKYVVTGCKNGTVVVWSFVQKQTFSKIEDDKQPIAAVSFIDKDIFVYAGFSGIIRFWDVGNNTKPIPDILDPKRKLVSFVPTSDGEQLYVSDSNNRISKYKIDKKNSQLEEIMENQRYVIGLTLDQENKHLYVVWGGITVKVFKVEEKKTISFYKVIGHDKLVAVRLTKDKKYLVAAYMDGGISFFELNSGELAIDFEDFYAARDILGNYPELGVEFDPDE